MSAILETTKALSKYSKILNNDLNFLRIPRKPFINFQTINIDLEKLVITKTKIESWDYEQKMSEIFGEKEKSAKSKEEIKLIEAIKKDAMDILESCFSLSDKHHPNEISLSLVKGIPCTKLHADFLPLRLICTYKGPGTIFLPRESTRYPCLNSGSANKRVLIKGKPSFQAEPFEILILKGRKFNKGELKPCAHRSPEVFNEEKRLVLKVDFI